jgi:hypothetical protein
VDIEQGLMEAYLAGLNNTDGLVDKGVVLTDILAKIELRRFTIGGWIFDVKQVRALKSANYGDPYTAIAHISLNGRGSYIDSLLSNDDNELSRDDMRSLAKASKKLGASNLSYERIKNMVKRDEKIDL